MKAHRMNSNLVMGYGNLDRMDDGIAFYVINKLRNRLGQKPLHTYNREPVSLGAQLDSIFVRQLVPELVSNAICYKRLVFLDAHVQIDKPDVMFYRLNLENVSSPLTHFLQPSEFLSIIKLFGDREPAAFLLSLKGHRFDFGRDLSWQTRKFADLAANIIFRLFLEQPYHSSSFFDRLASPIHSNMLAKENEYGR
jgi:hydrogenase maturation protease